MGVFLPLKSNMNWKIPILNRKYIFQWLDFPLSGNPTHRVYDLIYFRTVLFSYYFDPLKVQIAGVPYLYYIYIYRFTTCLKALQSPPCSLIRLISHGSVQVQVLPFHQPLWQHWGLAGTTILSPVLWVKSIGTLTITKNLKLTKQYHGDVCKVIFCGWYHGKSRWKKQHFGRILLDFFPGILCKSKKEGS